MLAENLLFESAELLGRIHEVLKKYPTKLPEGIGKKFFEFMTPQKAIESYSRSLDIATIKLV